jgi:hypothetical protein
MRPSALIGLLIASLASASAAAPARSRESAQRLAETLRANAPALRVSTRAPRLAGQVSDLVSALKSLVQDESVTAAAAEPVENEAEALLAALKRGPFDGPSAADKTLKLADDAQALLSPPAAAAGPGTGRHDAAVPPPESGALEAFSKHAGIMAGLMKAVDFDGGASAASASPLAPAPLPRARETARQAQPVDSERTSYDQAALNAFLKSQRRRALGTDGVPGPATQKAVAFFQEKKGLPKTGVIDRDTEQALLADFQERRRLPVTGALDDATAKALRSRRQIAASKEPVYFHGSERDFEAKAGAKTIKSVLATVYTPYLAKTKKQRRLEGPPIDHHDQAVCTLERYLAETCPYVSVAIDPRLDVPNGTPLLIPEISDLVGRPVRFRIVDTGSRKRFKGTGHIDIATDSNQHNGYGRLISGRDFTLVLPEGLHPTEL